MRIMKFIGLTAVVLLATSVATIAQNWEIIPGRSVGAITKNSSEKDLFKIFGAQNVKRGEIDVGEGETRTGTIVFPNDPKRRIMILWRDPNTHTGVERVTMRGKMSLWKTDRGITIGATLKTIERLNGRPFALTGFGWDYSGTVLHSNGGLLLAELGFESGEDIRDRTLILRLEPLAYLRRTAEYRKMSGEEKFFSDNPAMQKLNPRVYEMIVEFPL